MARLKERRTAPSDELRDLYEDLGAALVGSDDWHAVIEESGHNEMHAHLLKLCEVLHHFQPEGMLP